LVKRNPLQATGVQYFSGAEQSALDRQLVATDGVGLPLDPEKRGATLKLLDSILDQLAQYRAQDLTPTQRVSAASMEFLLKDARAAADYADTQFIFDQFRGMQVGLVNGLSQTHPIRNAQDIDNYLERLKQVGGIIDQGIAAAEIQEKKGLLPPKFIIQATLDGLDRFLKDAPAQNVLVVSLAARAEKLPVVPPDRDKSLALAQEIVATSVQPAFQRIKIMLTRQLAKATDDAGLWRLPKGDAAYRLRLHSNTTTDLTPRPDPRPGSKASRQDRSRDGSDPQAAGPC